MKRSFLTGRMREVAVRDLICIREFFPADRRAAIRQKARWVVGITMQGWAKLGWQGNWWIRYMLYRDRKSLLTNLINLLGYLVVILVVSVWVASALSAESYRYPPLVEPGSWLWNVMIVNGLLLLLRLQQRAYCVYKLYDWRQALLSAPRMVWGNVINFFATCRAIRLYARYLRTGKLIAWDKTSHVYPSEEELLPLAHGPVRAVNAPTATA
jgi:adsorption protein B